MVLIGDYTDTDKVRAVAGLTDNEVDDATLQAMGLSTVVLADLHTWLPTHATIKAEGEAPAPTPEQALRFDVLKLYATTLAAMTALQSSMHIPQQKSNGKDTAKRFSDSALKDAIGALQARLDKYRNQLLELISPIGAVSSGLFAIATPTYDPVTNE